MAAAYACTRKSSVRDMATEMAPETQTTTTASRPATRGSAKTELVARPERLFESRLDGL